MEPKNEEERRKTLQALIELAGGSSASDCWDDRRAEDLLRSQSTPAELRVLGMSEDMITRVFEESAPGGEAREIDRYRSEAPKDHSGPGVNDARPSDSRTPDATLHTPSFTVRVSARFEAAHFLREYRGISEPLHGHSYLVEADFAAASGGVDNDAIAVDFVSARRTLEALAKTLDYCCINDVPPFDTINPSAENIAEWFANALGEAVAKERATVQAITIWEGPVSSVTFRP